MNWIRLIIAILFGFFVAIIARILDVNFWVAIGFYTLGAIAYGIISMVEV